MKPKRPRTKPTGFVPSPGKKVIAPEKAMPADEQLDAKALLVKITYAQQRRAWETMRFGEVSEYTPGRSHDETGPMTMADDESVVVKKAKASAWRALVTWCEERHISPDVYVRCCFRGLPLKGEAPAPRHLTSDKYLAKWVREAGDIENRLTESLETQKRDAVSRITYNQRVLGNDAITSYLMAFAACDLPLTPLFRYCMAVSIKNKRLNGVIDTFVARAVLQFECYRDAYKRTWKEILPKGFSAMSRRVYPFLLAKLGHQLMAEYPV